MVIEDETQVKLLAWYDNKWGYANRMMDLVKNWPVSSRGQREGENTGMIDPGAEPGLHGCVYAACRLTLPAYRSVGLQRVSTDGAGEDIPGIRDVVRSATSLALFSGVHVNSAALASSSCSWQRQELLQIAQCALPQRDIALLLDLQAFLYQSDSSSCSRVNMARISG